MAAQEQIKATQASLLADEWNLTDDQRAFAEEYLANGMDGKKAYLAVKPSVTPGTAAKQACVWLKRNDELRRYIEHLRTQAAEKAELTAVEFLMKTRRLYRQCSGDVAVPDNVWNDTKGQMQTVMKRQFNAAGAGKAVEMLGRYAGVFVDKTEHSFAEQEEGLSRIRGLIQSREQQDGNG